MIAFYLIGAIFVYSSCSVFHRNNIFDITSKIEVLFLDLFLNILVILRIMGL